MPHATICAVLHDEEQTYGEVHARAEPVARSGKTGGGRGEDAEVVGLHGPRAEESWQREPCPPPAGEDGCSCVHVKNTQNGRGKKSISMQLARNYKLVTRTATAA